MGDPRRDPPALIESEPMQEGVLRRIHPIGQEPIVVGSYIEPMEVHKPMRYPDNDNKHIVKESVVATSRDGRSRRRFAAGTSVNLGDAYAFGLLDDEPKVGVRPDGETAAVADDKPIEYSERSEGTAPENRMEPAPENRSEVLDPLGELSNAEYEALSPAEKGKRTKAAKANVETEA